MLLLRHDVAAGRFGTALLGSVFEGLARKEKRQFTAALVDTVRPVEIRTAAGLYLGNAATYRVDVRAFDRVMERTLRGLYFHERGVRLADPHGARVFTLAAMDKLEPDTEDLLRRLTQFAISGGVRTIGDRVFSYAYQMLSDEPVASVWVFLVYERVSFLGLTGRREDFPGVTG